MEQTQAPKSFQVSNNYPNPFNSATSFKVDVYQPDIYTVQIINITGRIVNTLYSSKYFSGSQNILWDGRDDSGNDVPSGAYFARVSTLRYAQQIQLLLVR